MDPISIAIALSKFAPTIAGWFGGDDAEKTAAKVVDIAKQVTGLDDANSAMSKIHSDPALQIQFQQSINPIIIARLENETKQQAQINTTMRVELNSNDKFKSYWRPALGWVVVTTFAFFMLSIIFVIVYGVFGDTNIITKFMAALSSLMGTMTVMWSMALGVLGVNIKKRSDDKALAAGLPPNQGVLGTMANRWLGDRNG